MSRQQVLAIVCTVLVALAAVSGGVAAEQSSPYDDKLSGVADMETLLGYSVPEAVVTSGADADPHWYVTVETEDDTSALRQWANASDRRTVLATADTRTLRVRASPRAVLGGLERDGLSLLNHGDGLVAKSYVEHISTEQRHAVAPVGTLASESEASGPAPDILVQGRWDASSLAFGNDVNTTTLGQARDAIGDDQVASEGGGVTIAVVDTGLNVDNTSSPSLYGSRIVAAKNTISGDRGLENVTDGSSHGSWVSAAAAANATNDSYDGVATNADLVVAKSLGDDGSGSTQDIVEGIRFAEAQGADLIGLSLGSVQYSPQLAEAIRDALRGNTTAVFVAAGNSAGRPVGHFVNSPADVPEPGVITVGATNTANASEAQPAYFSSRGPDAGRDGSRGVTIGQEVDLAAPGMEIEAPVYTEAGYRENATKSGTSMSQPVALGVGALVLAEHPSLVNDTAAFRERMLETAVPVPAAGYTEVGNGLVHSENAVSDTRPGETQEKVRVDAAIARDQANRGYSGAGLTARIAEAI
jgi:hypothetical protein